MEKKVICDIWNAITLIKTFYKFITLKIISNQKAHYMYKTLKVNLKFYVKYAWLNCSSVLAIRDI